MFSAQGRTSVYNAGKDNGGIAAVWESGTARFKAFANGRSDEEVGNVVLGGGVLV